MIDGLIALPFIVVLVMLVIAAAVLAFAFWVWMIVDVAKRSFRNDTEKIVWILVVVLAQLAGALIYYLVIRIGNPKGISKK